MDTFVVKVKRSLKEGVEAFRHFGWGVAFSHVSCIWSNESTKSIQLKNKTILTYLRRTYNTLIEQYANKERSFEISHKGDSAPVWVFWFQGEQQMPELIRACQRSRIRAAGTHPVVLLDKDNIKKYISFPKEVWARFEEGKLRVQHLADMIRVHLLRQYGGLWLDASIFCHRQIPEEIFSYPFYSLKGKYLPDFVSGNQWTTFLIGGRPNNILCSFLDDFFMEWIKSGKPFIDYFMFDCAIALAYETIPAVKEEIDIVPESEGDYYWLNQRLSQPASGALLKEFKDEASVFYKIAWNKDWGRVKQGTLYEYLINNTDSE